MTDYLKPEGFHQFRTFPLILPVAVDQAEELKETALAKNSSVSYEGCFGFHPK